MPGIIDLLLLLFFASAVACRVAFSSFKNRVGGTYLDTAFTEAGIQSVLSPMTDEQREWHIKLTLRLDSAFMISYGFVFIGLPLKSFTSEYYWLAVPGLLAVAADAAESIVQLRLLRGKPASLRLKSFLTISKFAMFTLAAMICIVAFYQRKV